MVWPVVAVTMMVVAVTMMAVREVLVGVRHGGVGVLVPVTRTRGNRFSVGVVVMSVVHVVDVPMVV